MHLQNKIAEPEKSEGEIFNGDALREGLRLEEILHRAHRVHRSRGGLIGYDLEDWQQAERELMEEIRRPVSESNG